MQTGSSSYTNVTARSMLNGEEQGKSYHPGSMHRPMFVGI